MTEARERERKRAARRVARRRAGTVYVSSLRRRATTTYLNAATRAATIANRALTRDPLDTVVRC